MRGALPFAALGFLLCLGAPPLASGQAAETERAAEEVPPEAEPETEPAPQVHDLQAVLRAARQHYPALRAARHRHDAARARLSEATFSPFFQLTGTAGLTLSPEAHGGPIFSPDDQLPLSNTWRPLVRVGIEGAIPLFTFGKLSAARAAARAGVRAANHDRARAVDTLRSRVREAYYSLQLALDVQQMIAEGQGRLESAARRLEERIEAGDPDTNEHDRWRLSTTLAEVEGRRSEAVRLERSARHGLQVLSGLEQIRIPDCPIAQVPIELEPLAQYQALIGHRPDALMLQAGVAARRANVTATRARLLPDFALALSASYSYGPGITDQTNPFIIDSANYTGLGAGLVARWSLDFVGNAQRLRRADAELEATQAQAEEAQSGMALEVATTYERLVDAQRREVAWGRGHRDARAWFVAAAGAYQVGASEPRELVDAVRAYFTARFNHLSAIRDFNVSLAAMERATGTPVVPPAAWEAECTE